MFRRPPRTRLPCHSPPMRRFTLSPRPEQRRRVSKGLVAFVFTACFAAPALSPARAQPGVTTPSVPQRERLAATGVERAGYRWGDGQGADSSLRLASTLEIGGVTVTRTLAYPSADDTSADAAVMRTFRVADGRTEIATWTDEVTGSWIDGVDVLAGDLDGDGAREIVVVEHVGTGNGLGVATWEVFVVPLGRPVQASSRRAAAPMRFLTADYGPTGLVQRIAPGAGGLRLVAASWEDGREARRGPGLYYTARFYRYADGRLVPDGPVAQRRLLNSFQALRGREDEAGTYRPDRWLRTGTRRIDADPAVPAASGPRERVTLGPFEPYVGYRIEGREAVGAALGDASTRRLFPGGYVPLGQGATWPSGLEATLESVSVPGDSEPRRLLWLDR